MGRKPINDAAMTPAERQQRRRAGLKQEPAPAAPAIVGVDVGGEAEEARTLAPRPAADVSSVSDADLAELIEQLEAEVERRRSSVTLGSILAKARRGTAV